MVRYFEDLEVGDTWHSEPVSISEADIIAFAQKYDPQPFHINPFAGAASQFGSLIASGWQVACLAMREWITANPEGVTETVGLAVDEMRFRQPVRPADELSVRRKIVFVRPSSKGGRGIVKSDFAVTNQLGATVLTMSITAMVPSRS